MEQIKLGNSNLHMSKLSLGTWAYSGAKVWGECDEKAAIATIHSALEQGITLIDTAEKYGDGKAEIVVGKALCDRRNKAVLASKVFAGNLHYDDVITACEASLKRLQTDHIDLYQIHWPNINIPVEETFRALEKLKKDGKIVEVGVCNHGVKGLAAIADYDIVSNQMPYSLLWRGAEAQISGAMEARNITMWAYSPLAQGLLTGKYKTLEDVPMNRRDTRMYSSKWNVGRHTDTGFETEIFDCLKELHKICDETGHSMVDLAFGFLKNKKNVGSILFGARNEAQLAENMNAYEHKIEAGVLAQLETLSSALKNVMGNNADLWENENGGRMY